MASTEPWQDMRGIPQGLLGSEPVRAFDLAAASNPLSYTVHTRLVNPPSDFVTPSWSESQSSLTAGRSVSYYNENVLKSGNRRRSPVHFNTSFPMNSQVSNTPVSASSLAPQYSTLLPDAGGTPPCHKAKQIDSLSPKYLTEHDAAEKSDQFFKTKKCIPFQKGICKRGILCNFAHGDEELQRPLNLVKTKLCEMWMRGSCDQQDCCKFNNSNYFLSDFAHGQCQLRFTDDYFKTGLCKFWKRGLPCEAGQQCRHAHGEAELRKRGYRRTERDKKKVPSVASHEPEQINGGQSAIDPSSTSTVSSHPSLVTLGQPVEVSNKHFSQFALNEVSPNTETSIEIQNNPVINPKNGRGEEVIFQTPLSPFGSSAVMSSELSPRCVLLLPSPQSSDFKGPSQQPSLATASRRHFYTSNDSILSLDDNPPFYGLGNDLKHSVFPSSLFLETHQEGSKITSVSSMEDLEHTSNNQSSFRSGLWRELLKPVPSAPSILITSNKPSITNHSVVLHEEEEETKSGWSTSPPAASTGCNFSSSQKLLRIETCKDRLEDSLPLMINGEILQARIFLDEAQITDLAALQAAELNIPNKMPDQSKLPGINPLLVSMLRQILSSSRSNLNDPNARIKSNEPIQEDSNPPIKPLELLTAQIPRSSSGLFSNMPSNELKLLLSLLELSGDLGTSSAMVPSIPRNLSSPALSRGPVSSYASNLRTSSSKAEVELSKVLNGPLMGKTEHFLISLRVLR